MTAKTEPELLEAARAGDAEALTGLIALCQPRVYRFAMRMCRNPDDAQDVLQETLIALARSVRDLRDASRLATWLFSVARSFCSKHRGRPATRSSGDQAPIPDGANDVVIADESPSAEERLSARDSERSLRKALQALSREHREVLILRDGEGLTAPEVAQVLEISADAVKSRLHRARAALKEALQSAVGRGPAVQAPARCPDVLTAYSRHLENDISADLCRAMEEHLAGCRHCTETCDSLKQALAVCGVPARDPVPAAVQAAVRHAVRDAICTMPK